MKKADVERLAFPHSGSKASVKRSNIGNIGTQPLVNTLIEKVGALRQSGKGVEFIFAIQAIIGGLVFVLTIRMVSGWFNLPTQIILGVTLMLLLYFGCIKLLSTNGSSPSERKLDFGELLEREVVPLSTSQASVALKGQTILVTGAAGSIGSELCRQLLDYEPGAVIALDTNETGIFDLVQSLQSHPHAECLYPYIGDIVDRQSMLHLFTKHRPEVVFHAAAYKHVPLLEQFPEQAVRTNILATFRLCRLAQEHRAARFHLYFN